MDQLLMKSRPIGFMLAAGMLLVVLGLSGAGLQSVNKAEAAPGSGVDYFLKIDGVEGESADAAHKGEIELNSYDWSKHDPGLEQVGAASGAGGGAGKVQPHDIYFAEQVSKASPLLMQAAASGKHFKEAVLTARKAGKTSQQFMMVKLSDVMISSYKTDGKTSAGPTDEFSLNFAKIEFSYSPQKADGSLDAPVVGSWDLKENKGL